MDAYSTLNFNDNPLSLAFDVCVQLRHDGPTDSQPTSQPARHAGRQAGRHTRTHTETHFYLLKIRRYETAALTLNSASSFEIKNLNLLIGFSRLVCAVRTRALENKTPCWSKAQVTGFSKDKSRRLSLPLITLLGHGCSGCTCPRTSSWLDRVVAWIPSGTCC